ncbi:secreted protein [Elysia marginata]|uniref:Secreted protein n=1 Tax=Elysia marginata TaxID=1093978 RepID=A0AAV4F727_9GAST|nr:secreted protein [Elysia marginata]
MSKSMKALISQYPEVLIMDATYKRNHYLLPLVTVMCIDQNGDGHPVLHAFVRHEDSNLIAKCLEFLSDKYDSSHTSTIFLDKDLSEVTAVKRVRNRPLKEPFRGKDCLVQSSKRFKTSSTTRLLL